MLKDLLENAGFNKIEIRAQGTDITVACHKVINIFFRLVTQKQFIFVKLAYMLLTIVCLPILLIFHIVGLISLFFNIGSINDTLGYLVIAEKHE